MVYVLCGDVDEAFASLAISLAPPIATALCQRWRGGDAGRIDQAHTNCTDGCFRPGVNPNLHVEVCHVIPRRLGCDPELAGDLLVGRTQSHEP
jgi:hypothetical protein